MHEMSLAESILQLVEQTALRERAQRVRQVVVLIGELSCVEPQALQFCFEAVTLGSMAQGAELVIEPVPGQGWCAACAQQQPMHTLYDACPVCDAAPMRVTGGTEMRVRDIAIE